MAGHDIGEAPQLSQREPRFRDAATFGRFLQDHRERLNISLQRVASETKIAPRHLSALERGDVTQWPGGLYRRAMMRAYAGVVGLNPNHMADEFAQLFNDHRETLLERSYPDATAKGRFISARRGSAGVTDAILAVAAIAFASWGLSISGGITQPSQVVAALPVARVDVTGTTGTGTTITSGEVPTPLPSTPQAQVVEPQKISMGVEEARVGSVLQVTSNPAGAQVTVNGVRWGDTPLTIRYLAPGDKRVRLTRDGYVSAERIVRLTQGLSQSLSVDLSVAP